MEVFRRMGFFGCWETTSTHNSNGLDTEGERWRMFLGRQQGENYDYRGKGIFSGMQFIYKHPRGVSLQTMELRDLLKICIADETVDDIVIDRINIGTYDYVSPYDNMDMHFRYDVKPWLKWGNAMDTVDISEVIMPGTVLSIVMDIFERLRGDLRKIEEAKNEIEMFVGNACPQKPI